MSAEVRNLPEGQVWWVAASGSGTTWATADTPASGLFGYVQSMDFTSAQTFVHIMERGIPHHKKFVSKSVIAGNINCLWSGYTPSAVSGSGASVPMFHLEHQADTPENLEATGRFHQFYGVTFNSKAWGEAGEGDTLGFQFEALAMNGPTASGYLSN